MSLFTKVFGTRFKRELKRIRPIVEAIHRHEESYKDYSEAQLQAQTAGFRQQIAEGTGALGTSDGLWAAPGAPYRSLEGGLAGFRFAREWGVPFVGT